MPSSVSQRVRPRQRFQIYAQRTVVANVGRQRVQRIRAVHAPGDSHAGQNRDYGDERREHDGIALHGAPLLLASFALLFRFWHDISPLLRFLLDGGRRGMVPTRPPTVHLAPKDGSLCRFRIIFPFFHNAYSQRERGNTPRAPFFRDEPPREQTGTLRGNAFPLRRTARTDRRIPRERHSSAANRRAIRQARSAETPFFHTQRTAARGDWAYAPNFAAAADSAETLSCAADSVSSRTPA